MFGKDMEFLSSKVEAIKDENKLSSYVGKKVFSKSGEYVGTVQDVVVNKDFVIGVICKGKMPVFIDKEFFESDSADAIMLKIEPVTSIIGKKVFDATGKKIGTVSDLDRKTNANAYNSLMVKKNALFKPFLIPKKDVAASKHSVLLKGEYKKEEDAKGKDNNE